MAVNLARKSVFKTERKRIRKGRKEEGEGGRKERLKRDQTAMTRKFSGLYSSGSRSFLPACPLPVPIVFDIHTTHPSFLLRFFHLFSFSSFFPTSSPSSSFFIAGEPSFSLFLILSLPLFPACPSPAGPTRTRAVSFLPGPGTTAIEFGTINPNEEERSECRAGPV